ncbi:hypothetical protein [Litoribacter populi]|uniref:hypothetical protein n=1 Tax=Litoribacter populi TaxID=2598460 RepID=UPI00117C390D|nr:hypothetical protein [Litoribacter populi]
MLLRNFDIAASYINYYTKEEIENNDVVKISGWYKVVNGVFSAIFVSENKLYFIYGEEKILIKESSKVFLNKISDSEEEFLLIENEIIVKFTYRCEYPLINFSPFEYIDEDDFKWAGFIEKIINDKNRQRNFVLNIMEG